MDSIEKAIRAAFAKGDAEDRAFREKVYRSAFAALDRALQQHPELTVEKAITRRKTLQSKIAEIETEFLPAVAPRAARQVPIEAAAAPSVDAPRGRPVGAAPEIVPDRRGRRPRPVDAVAPAAERRGRAVEVEADHDPRRARRRFPFARLFVTVTMLALIAVGVGWAYNTGLFGDPSTLFSTQPATVDDEDYTPPADGDTAPAPLRPAEQEDSRAWITVFAPADTSAVSAPSGASVEVREDDSGQFLRVRSGAGGSAVLFTVGQGVLEQLAGKKAVFDIVARAEDGQATEMSVVCDFGALGDCGRKRYAVARDSAEFLFDVTFASERAAAAGSIAITSDVGAGTKAVDIYEIRASVAE